MDGTWKCITNRLRITSEVSWVEYPTSSVPVLHKIGSSGCSKSLGAKHTNSDHVLRYMAGTCYFSLYMLSDASSPPRILTISCNIIVKIVWDLPLSSGVIINWYTRKITNWLRSRHWRAWWSREWNWRSVLWCGGGWPIWKNVPGAAISTLKSPGRTAGFCGQ